MKLLIFFESANSYQIYSLPNVIDGNYWVQAYDESEVKKNILNIFASEGHWVFLNPQSEKIILELFHFYTVPYKNKNVVLYTLPLYNSTLEIFSFQSLDKFSVGNSDADIIYSDYQGKVLLAKKNTSWIMQCDNAKNAVYVNQVLTSGKLLESGDHIFIKGLNIYVLGSYFAIDNPNDKSIFNVHQDFEM